MALKATFVVDRVHRVGIRAWNNPHEIRRRCSPALTRPQGTRGDARLRKMMLAGWLAATALMTSAALAQAPVNDNIAAAVTFTSASFFNSVNTEEATPQPGEPSCAGSGHSVWYA